MRFKERWVFRFFMILTIIIIALSLACDGTGGNGGDDGEPTTYSILGQVTANGTGLSGVTITLSGNSSGTTTTDNNGDYSFTGLSNGSYAVIPSLTGYTFDPTSRDVTTSGADVSGVDFTASLLRIKTETTDSNGEAVFTDNSTQEEVILKVVDTNNNPLSNMDITYWDGDGYEVFFVDDPFNEYLPSIGIYSHNSNHVIKTGKNEYGIYEIYTIDEDNFLGNVVWSWRTENNLGFQTYNYETTVDYDEYIEIYGRQAVVTDILWKVLGIVADIYIGFSLPGKPSEIVNYLFPEEKNPPQRWDIYWYRKGEDKDFHITMIPSNIPTVRIYTLNIASNEVNITWEGADKDTYDQLVFLPDNMDLTKYLDGNSTSDLIYSYRITQNGVVYNGYDWTAFDSNTSTTIIIWDYGNYTLELRVKDEVDNIGYTDFDFDIDGGNQTCTDADGDGYYAESGCGTAVDPDDNDATIYPVASEKILFVSNRDGNADIYIMDPDGSNQMNLINNLSHDYDPEWSPDGNSIVFVSERDGTADIYTMNLDGSDLSQLTYPVNPSDPGDGRNRDDMPDWSPNGTKIVFFSLRDGNSKIWLMNADGSNQIKLDLPFGVHAYPRWSPDGNEIVFTSTLAGEGHFDIYKVNVSNPSNPIRLTNSPYTDIEPVWAPDGSKIAFTSNRYHNGEVFYVYIMNSDGSNQRTISDTSLGTNQQQPSWSPDGTKIAYTLGNSTPWVEIWSMNSSDGSNKTRLSYFIWGYINYDHHPAWTK